MLQLNFIVACSQSSFCRGVVSSKKLFLSPNSQLLKLLSSCLFICLVSTQSNLSLFPTSYSIRLPLFLSFSDCLFCLRFKYSTLKFHFYFCQFHSQFHFLSKDHLNVFLWHIDVNVLFVNIFFLLYVTSVFYVYFV